MDLERIQEALREHQLGGWLLCDFHHRDPLAYRILGLDASRMTTRRWFYFIPARGEPKKLSHFVEKRKLDSLPGRGAVYLSWPQLHRSLARMLGRAKTVAMQYSPQNHIPTVSLVDAGLVELVRSMGHRVVSSADLVQQFAAVIGAEGYRLHKEAGKLVDQIRAAAFAHIRHALSRKRALTECGLQQFILQQFAANGLVTASPPMFFRRAGHLPGRRNGGAF